MACKLYHKTPAGTYLRSLPKSDWPELMKDVIATVLKADTDRDVCSAAAGWHQLGQDATKPSTMSAWCRHFCASLNHLQKTGLDLSLGVPKGDLLRILFASGIPVQALLGVVVDGAKKAPVGFSWVGWSKVGW